MTPNERVDRMIDIMEKLVHVLSNENEAIDKGQFGSLESIVNEKNILMENYEMHVKYLDKNPHLFLDADAELMEVFVAVGEDLEEVSKINEEMLRLANEAGQVMVSSIAEAATMTSNRNKGYKSNGLHEQAGEQVAVAYNERL